MDGLFSLVEGVLTEREMTKGDKNRETRLKKKIDKDKKLMKNPKVKKALANLDKQLDKYTKSVEKAAQGIDTKEFE